MAFSTEAGARYFLKNVSTEQLLKEEKTRLVYLEMLTRPGLQDEVRREATAGLARLSSKPELTVIMDAIRSLDAREGATDSSVVFDLVRQLTSRPAAELGAARAELEKLATSAKQPVFRQIGFVSLINVDGSVEPAWKVAVGSSSSLLDFVRAMPLISDAAVRSSLYERVESLLEKLPAPLAEEAAKGTKGRYVRIELPGNGTLTLAEVEVYSGGTNVARKGRAIQKNTGHGGDAMKAIDGNKSGSYGDGGQTHTEENTRAPYWEVDLGPNSRSSPSLSSTAPTGTSGSGWRDSRSRCSTETATKFSSGRRFPLRKRRRNWKCPPEGREKPFETRPCWR